MTNTLIDYMYRDAHNYKEYGQFVLEGELTGAEQNLLHEALGEQFLPAQIGLPALQPSNNPDFDHIWHECLMVVSTIGGPSDPTTPAQEVFEKAMRIEWDEDAAQAELEAKF